MVQTAEGPAVSVIVCAYNSGERIRATIDAILTQDFNDLELIIIDDGSSDNTVDVIRTYEDPRLRLLQNEKNQGVSISRNNGLDACRGLYIATCDHDDVWRPGKLAAQVSYMEAHPDCGVVSCFWKNEMANNRLEAIPSEKCAPAVLAWSLFTRAVFLHSSLLMRASVMQDNGIRYRDGYAFADDWLICHEFARVSLLGMVQKNLLTYCYTGENWAIKAEEKMHNGGISCMQTVIETHLERPVAHDQITDLYKMAVLGKPAESRDALLVVGGLMFEIAMAQVSRISGDTNAETLIKLDAGRIWWRIIGCTIVLGSPGTASFSDFKNTNVSFSFRPSLVAQLWVHFKTLREKFKRRG